MLPAEKSWCERLIPVFAVLCGMFPLISALRTHPNVRSFFDCAAMFVLVGGFYLLTRQTLRKAASIDCPSIRAARSLRALIAQLSMVALVITMAAWILARYIAIRR